MAKLAEMLLWLVPKDARVENEKLKDPPVEDTDEAPAKRRRGVECVVEVSMVPWSPCSARAKGHKWQM